MSRTKKGLISVIILLLSLASLSWYSASRLKKVAGGDSLISEIPKLSEPYNMESVSIDGLNVRDSETADIADRDNEHRNEPTKEKTEKKDGDGDKKETKKEDNKKSTDKNNTKNNKKNNNKKNVEDDDKADDSSVNNESEESEFTDNPADIFVEDTMTVSSLLDEIGIDDEEKIIYVKCVTGIGSETAVQAINGIYSLLLSTTGTTVIHVKYIDSEGNTQTYVKKIDYVRPEGATPKGKEPLIHTNLKDMGVYNNPIINFDVWLTDYRGNPLAYNNADIRVNGEKADYVGEMERQTYRTTLSAGTNIVEIKIKDKYQYTVKKTYTLYYSSGSGKATMSLEGGTIGKKYFIEPTEIEIEPGIPLSYILVDFLKANGYSYSYVGTLDEGFYLAKVSKKNMIKGYRIPDDLKAFIIEDALIFDENNYESLDSLGEFDFCQGSGWMYSINGLYSSYGFNKAFVQDGDEVRVRFTLAYGKDISGYEVTSGAYGRLGKYDGEW